MVAILTIQLFPMWSNKYDDHIATQSFHFPQRHYFKTMAMTRNLSAQNKFIQLWDLFNSKILSTLLPGDELA